MIPRFQGSKTEANDNPRQERWQDAIRHCETELGKEDFKLVVKYKSPEELHSAIDEVITSTKRASVPRILKQLKPHLRQVHTFVLAVIAATALPVVGTVCIWGLITFMVQV
jgi:TPP-dependent 2-oxoacid decarboxylase